MCFGSSCETFIFLMFFFQIGCSRIRCFAIEFVKIGFKLWVYVLFWIKLWSCLWSRFIPNLLSCHNCFSSKWNSWIVFRNVWFSKLLGSCVILLALWQTIDNCQISVVHLLGIQITKKLVFFKELRDQFAYSL